MKKAKRIKIMRQSCHSMWYDQLIGYEFDVMINTKNEYLVEVGGKSRVVNIDDCEVVEWEEPTYAERQAECGLKVGDRVRVTRRAKFHESGWGTCWSSLMNNMVDNIFVIDKISNIYGIKLTTDVGSYYFPYFALEKVEEPQKENMKVYLSGAITGDPNYKQHFAEAEKKLVELGYTVCNPCKVTTESYEEYLRIDLVELLECNYICYVNDVTTSKGAFLEKIVADAVGIVEIKRGDE